MKPVERDLIDAWLIASADLGVQVLSPFVVERPGESPASFRLLIRGFGSSKGTLICTTDDDLADAFAVAERAGYYASGLNPARYSRYERQHFIDTLEDWGWFGDGTRPAWLKGKSPWG